jgi:hypothetical protein
VQLEKAGVASVTIVTDEFLNLATTEAQMRGMSDLPLVRVPHPVGTIGLDRLAAIAEGCVEAIIARISKPIDGVDCGWAKSPTGERGAQTALVEVPSELAAMLSEVVARGWSDGLPVLPPTRQAVELMFQTIGLNADHVLGVIPPLNGIATIEKIAANAVMAGCLPEYFPLVIAAVKGMLQPGFNLDGVQTTTGNVAPVVIVNGACRDALQINYGATPWARVGAPMRRLAERCGLFSPISAALGLGCTINQP